MINNKIRLGIIGFGKRGNTHLRNFLSVEDVNVVAICDIKKIKLRKSLQNKIKQYDNYLKMITSENVDAVSICLPTHLHYEVTKSCLKKGVNVLLEKPATLNEKELQRLIKMTKTLNLVLMIGYNLRFNKKIQEIKSIIDSNELGSILMIRGRQSHNWGGLNPFGWLMDKTKSGGGTIIDNASHYLDLFEYFLGNISEVLAFSNNSSFRGEVEDNALIGLKFKNNNIIGSIETSWQDASGRNNHIIIWGSRAVLEFKESNCEQVFEIKNYKNKYKDFNRIMVQRLYIPRGIEQVSKKVNIDNTPNIDKEDTIMMINYFINLIKNPKERKKFEKIYNPLRNKKLIDATYMSLKNKKVIKI